MLNSILKDCKIVKVSNGAAAGQTAVTTSTFDMSGYDSVCLIADLAAVTDGCVLSLKAQDGNQANGGDAADISGATTGTFTASSSSNKLVVLDAVQPQLRYVTAVLGRTTQNAVVNTIIAILYRTKTKPVTPDASVILSAVAECAA